MADTSEDSLPEDCVCPICFDVYVGHVFQCVNGHAVCVRCVKPLSACPKCHISYNGAPIRVRALENMLDRMSFDCKFKENGCNLKLKRAEFSSHIKSCDHGGIDLCHILGLLCNKKAYTQNIQKALRHLMRDHGIKMEGKLRRFNLQTLPFNYCHLPVMFDTADPNSRVIVSFVTSESMGSATLKVVGVRVRLNPNVAVKKIQLEFRFIAKNEVILRKQEVDDVENCDSWTCSLLVDFRDEMLKHIMLEGVRVECTVIVNWKIVSPCVVGKKLEPDLKFVPVDSTPDENDSMPNTDPLSELLQQLGLRQK